MYIGIAMTANCVHFLQKHTFENYLIFISTYVNISCEIQVSRRNEVHANCQQNSNCFCNLSAKFAVIEIGTIASLCLSPAVLHHWCFEHAQLKLQKGLFYHSRLADEPTGTTESDSLYLLFLILSIVANSVEFKFFINQPLSYEIPYIKLL